MGQLCSQEKQDRKFSQLTTEEKTIKKSQINSQIKQVYQYTDIDLEKPTLIIIPFICKNKPELSFELTLNIYKEESQQQQESNYKTLQQFDNKENIEKNSQLADNSILKEHSFKFIIEQGKKQFQDSHINDDYMLFDFKAQFLEIPNETKLFYFLDILPIYFQAIRSSENEVLEIYIKTITGKRLPFTLQSTQLILDLKQAIQKKTKVEIDRQILFHRGHKLFDGKSFLASNITGLSELYLTFKNKEANSDYFQPNQKQKHKEVMLLKREGPEYRKICFGINIEGTCENNQCFAKDNRVICQINQNYIDLKHDADLIICPMCKQKIKPLYFGFSRCKFMYTSLINEVIGKKLQFLKSSNTKMKTIGDNYLLYEIQLKNHQNYKALIDIKAWDRLKDGSNIQTCGVCQQSVLDNLKFLSCGHLFHSLCYSKIQFIQKQCVICTIYQQ